jgi:two-component system, NarL family, response regulator LiaR
MTPTIKIMIADDHAIVREGLRSLIATEEGMQLVGEARDGVEAVQMFDKLRPDVALLDLMMPRKNGISAIQEIIEHYPQARILVLTSFAEDEQILPAIRAGAKGYLLKDSSADDLLHAIREVYGGESPLSPTIARKLIQEINRPQQTLKTFETLSERELEVLNLVADGLSNQEIAERLVISERTVRNHVGNILAKLNLENRTQAALYAVRMGLVKTG